MDKACSLNIRTLALLGLILLLGGAARFYNLAWDDWHWQHPDERHVNMTVGRLGWPSSFAEYLDEATSPLNPRNRDTHFYAYGTLPSTMLMAIMRLGGVERPEDIAFTGRVMSALADTAVIGLVFALAWTLYRRRNLALLAAAFYAAAVLPIQHAHFFVVDPMANFFVALALWLLARAWRRGSLLDYVWTGIALGLAISCKISVATLGLPVAIVSLLPSPKSPPGMGTVFLQIVRRVLIGAGRTFLFSLVMIATVRVALPDAFSGFWPWELAPRWLANMREVIDISTGVTDIVFTRQFYHRTPLLWPWINMVLWGLGLALGVTAWIGWTAAAWRLAAHKIWAHAVPVVCIATVFFHQGFTYQSTLRYFLPIYGSLCVLAAWALMSWCESKTRAAVVVWLGRVTTACVLIFTIGWAVGFVSIYSQPHTRVAASIWIYKNIPAGSTLACEHWDDWIPLGLPGEPSPDIYRQIEMPLYDVDNGEKRGVLLQKLKDANYIILASQKLRDSIPRMPHRYPFTISYYEGLDNGSLGFDKVAEFTRPIRFFGFPISTRGAEEAFSVYDHPPVVIYKKSARFDPDALVQRFNSIPLGHVTDTRDPSSDLRVGGGKPESAILLPEARWQEAQQEGTWSQMFNRESFSAKYPLVVWIGLLILLQAIGWGLTGSLLGQLPDRGAGLARLFGLLIPCWFLWLLASNGLGRSTRTSYWILLAAFALLAGLLVWRDRRGWSKWWRSRKGTFLRMELTFWAGFFLTLTIRWLNPDIWHAAWGGEKPMEMTFLNGVLRSEEFPPLNPWFGGGFINYYYFGFVLCGCMIKAVGVLPEVGFNLCLATFYGLACAAVLSAARALRPGRKWFGAWCATVFVMLIGNLFQIRFIWNCLVRIGGEDHQLKFPIISDTIRAFHGAVHVLQGRALSNYPEADLYWVAARAIGGDEVAPVTEFPFWSFLYADLHPHLMALPFTLAMIALAVAWVRVADWRKKLGVGGLLALTLGFFWPTNTWDWPTYGALTGLVMFLTAWRYEKQNAPGFIAAGIKSVAIFLVVLSVGRLAFLPFYQHYVAGYGTFERWQGPRTSLIDYLFIYGFFLFILVSAFVLAWRNDAFFFNRGTRLWLGLLRNFFISNKRRRRYLRLVWRRPGSVLGALFALFWTACLIQGLWRQSLPALLGCGLVIAIMAVWNRREEPVRAIPPLLVVIALTLSLVVEFVVLVGDIGRMNTVFKFYYQVWVCFAMSAAIALPSVLRDLRGWKPVPKIGWLFGLILLFGLAMLYPLTAVPKKIHDRFVQTRPTLDGLVFAEEAVYEVDGHRFPLRPDLLAIRWLEDNVEGSPVILEMNLDDILYTWGSRYSIHTGLPSVVGWNWHQRQQQAGIENSQVEQRIQDVRTIYRTPDTEEARQLLKKYGIRLIVVGELERAFGSPEGLQKFEQMGLSTIYDAEGVRIYRVP